MSELCHEPTSPMRCCVNKEPPEGGSSNPNRMIEDQAAISAGFDFRRYAMKPMPAKPRSIMAKVEGSGTPEAKSEAYWGNVEKS
jgi:hypothetical protein